MSIFRLQQFAIDQSRSGMKICSDSLLFGALIPVKGAKRILDIGSGTGLLSLMQAQKCSELSQRSIETITAVEITAEAAVEAEGNFSLSPWNHILKQVHQDIQSFAKRVLTTSSSQYDLIICNPPFFSQQSQTNASNKLRNIARHTDNLTYKDLCTSIGSLLTNTGAAYLLLPVSIKKEFTQCLTDAGLNVLEIIEISESEKHVAKVMVIKVSFQINGRGITVNELYKFNSQNCHSHEVRQYLSPFLLRYENVE